MMTVTRMGVRANVVRVLDEGRVDSATLNFDNGVESCRVCVEEVAPGNLLEAHFADPAPVSFADSNRVSFEYPLGSRLARRMARSRVSLAARVTWSLEVHSGVAGSAFDLRSGRLGSAVFHGGLAHTTIALPEPQGECLLRLQSVNQLTVVRPAGTALRLQLERGAAGVVFDDQPHPAASRYLTAESPGFQNAANRYVLRARGGVSGLTVEVG